MLTTSDRAAEKLREELVNKCLEAGIGFRMKVSTDESGRATFSIKLDWQHQGDKVVESDGIKVFLDTTSLAQVEDYQLDYQDTPEGGFFLNTVQEARDGRD